MINPYPTPLEKVKSQVIAYHQKMNLIAEELKNAPDHLKIDPKLEYLQFFIDRESFKNLAKMWDMDGTDSIAVFFGLANAEGSKHFGVTGCFVAVDADRKIVKGHFSKNDAPPIMKAEDTWIPPGGGSVRSAVNGELTLTSTLDEIDQKFKGQ